MKVLVTGSSGLIGSEAALFYDHLGHQIIGIDNNMRREFFGDGGDTTANMLRVKEATKNYCHVAADIRNKQLIDALFKQHRPDLIVHCAAQPSHDKAAEIPIIDFEVNALGTLNLLEATRVHTPEAVFIHMSTNKVYGDGPNYQALVEEETRYSGPEINESFSIDQCLHSLFGASKLSADIMAQEYGKYFGLKVGIFRGGCLTGPAHAGVEQHGFLSYLVKCAIEQKPYTVYGYKGKQVRDNIHSADVIAAFEEFRKNPKPGEVYNIGGGKENSVSILECLSMLGSRGYPVEWTYQETPRRGDHIHYISDLTKLKRDFPNWKVSRSISQIFDELLA